MNRRFISGSFGIAAVAIGAVFIDSTVSRASAPPDRPAFNTIAGTGQSTFKDGPASSASFIEPVAVAFAPDGSLYIADSGAQRIRKLKNSIVETIAGSGVAPMSGLAVPGGYADGSAHEAKFSNPSGVAVGPDGAVFVADTGNHTIRVVRNGRVSTYAGDAKHPGYQDGALAAATFTRPTAIAVAANGTAYVSDPPSVRVISQGRVSTLRFGDPIYNVALFERGSLRVLAAVSVNEVYYYDLARNTLERRDGNNSTARMAGDFAGVPSALAFMNQWEVIATDAMYDTVRLIQFDAGGDADYTRPLTAEPLQRASVTGGGYRDGNQGLVKSPMGIAVSKNGDVAIADTGNHRIRSFSGFNHDTVTLIRDLDKTLPGTADSARYRVALFGNSYIGTDQAWSESLAGYLQSRLHKSRPVKVFPIQKEGLPLDAAFSYSRSILCSGIFDSAVILIPDPNTMNASDASRSYGPGWEQKLAVESKEAAAACHQSGTKIAFVVHPTTYDLPGTSMFRKLNPYNAAGRLTGQMDSAGVVSRYRSTVRALDSSGALVIDSWQAFIAASQQDGAPELFATFDHHFTPLGVSVLARKITERAADL